MTTEATIGLSYIQTIPGILKIGQEVVNFIGMICVATAGNSGKGDAYLACSVMALIFTGILLVFYIMGLVTKLQIPWYKIEFFYCVIWAVFYLIVASLVVSPKSAPGGYIAGGVFGFAATILYALEAFYIFRTVAYT